MSKMKKTKEPELKSYDRVPKQIDLYGRTVKTFDDSERLNIAGNFGEARYGINQIALALNMGGQKIPADELKMVYLHELMHFILYFTGFEKLLVERGIDLEQFVDSMANGIYQYEKSAKY